jgi:hypothetical protein
MRKHKLRSGVNCQVVFKQKGVKKTAVKQGLGVFTIICLMWKKFLERF